MRDTDGSDYAERLQRKQNVRWKQVLKVQAPYRWNLRRHDLGCTLDVGCGIGRNLACLPAGSVGVDHNPTSIDIARTEGCVAYTTAEWETAPEREPEHFDALLVSHVIEHMSPGLGFEVVASYLPWVRPGGKVLFICPQERGYASDPTHVRWTTGRDLERLARGLGLEPRRSTSFPLPRFAGKAFTYNEFIVLAVKPSA